MEETGDLLETLFGLIFFFGVVLTCGVPIWLLHRVRTARQTKNLTSVIWVTRRRLLISPNYDLGSIFLFFLTCCFCSIFFPFIALFDSNTIVGLVSGVVFGSLLLSIWHFIKDLYKQHDTLCFTDNTLYVYDYFCLSKPRQYELSTIFWKKETEYFRGGSIKTVISFYHENTRIAFLRCKQCINGKEIEKYIKNNISSTPL